MRLIRKSLLVTGGDYLFTSTDFTYTGSYTWIDEGSVNGKSFYRIKFLTSGTFTPKKNIRIDLFLVGGGGGGGYGYNTYPGGGGGGGYASTIHSIVLLANQAYSIAIGAAGSRNRKFISSQLRRFLDCIWILRSRRQCRLRGLLRGPSRRFRRFRRRRFELIYQVPQRRCSDGNDGGAYGGVAGGTVSTQRPENLGTPAQRCIRRRRWRRIYEF
jgi:hypothetical protein